MANWPNRPRPHSGAGLPGLLFAAVAFSGWDGDGGRRLCRFSCLRYVASARALASFIGPSFIARILSSAFARNSVRREIPLASAASSTSALAAWTDAEQVRKKLLALALSSPTVR